MLAMEIKIGDRFTDQDDFEWEILTHPVVLHGGKSLRTRIGRPGVPETERELAGDSGAPGSKFPTISGEPSL
jgi:hypothetical protein